MKPIHETRETIDQLAAEGDPEVGATLLQMGQRAKDIVPECVGLSLGLLQSGITLTLVATDEEVAILDAVQYLDGGPCVEAAHRNTTSHHRLDDQPLDDDPLGEETWRMFASAAAASGVASTLTLPIERDGQVIGSVNIYAATADAFDDREEELADALGASARAAISNADLGFDTRLQAVEAPEKLSGDREIDIAVGMIAEAQGIDVHTAQERLRQSAGRAGITELQAARALGGLLRK